MSKPIPIGASSPQTPPATIPAPGPSQSPTSSVSISPRTPFYPAQGLASPPLPGLAGLSTTAPASEGFFKWASNFSKSPSVPTDLTRADDLTPRPQAIEKAEEEHDSFEFGDWNDLKSRAWNKNRRALSMSMPRGQSGITAMLSPPGAGGAGAFGRASEGQVMPPTSVMADKAAKAQGVLRRISFSNNLSRPTFGSSGPLSPPLQCSASGFAQPAIINKDASTAQSGVGADLHRAKTISGPPSEQRGRRTSEQRKRGVSPMGERLLRDHGHF